MNNFGKGHYEEYCGIIYNLDQWFRRCHLKYFLSRGVAAILLGRAEPFRQFWWMAFRETSCVKLFLVGPVV